MNGDSLHPVKIKDLKLKNTFKKSKNEIALIYELIDILEAYYQKFPSSVFHLLDLKEAFEGLQNMKPKASFKKVMADSKHIKFLNYQSALKKLSRRKKVTIPLILQTHLLIQKNIKKDAGKIREAQNWIGPEGCSIDEAYFLPPKASDILKNLKALFSYLEDSQDEPIIKLALFFAQFLVIHPFMDGNGRCMRAILSPLSKQLNITKMCPLFISGYFKKHRLRYFETLYLITEKNDFRPWIQFFLKAMISSLKTQVFFCRKLAFMYESLGKQKDKLSHFHLNIDKLFYLIFVDPKWLNKAVYKTLKENKWIMGKNQAYLKGMPELIRKIND
jgi:Fic family protein